MKVETLAVGGFNIPPCARYRLLSLSGAEEWGGGGGEGWGWGGAIEAQYQIYRLVTVLCLFVCVFIIFTARGGVLGERALAAIWC